MTDAEQNYILDGKEHSISVPFLVIFLAIVFLILNLDFFVWKKVLLIFSNVNRREKKILPLHLPGLEPETFRSRVRRSTTALSPNHGAPVKSVIHWFPGPADSHSEFLATDSWFKFKLHAALRPQRPYGLFRDWGPRTSTSTFTQLLSSALPTSPFFFFTVALRPLRPYRLLGTGSPGRLSRLSHSCWALRRNHSFNVA